MSVHTRGSYLALADTELARIVSTTHDTLTDASGHRLIDLFSANGAALLGHAHPSIAAAIKAQLDGVWLTGGLPTPAHDQAKAALEALLPGSLSLAGFYTTGMEAAEFAMRMARVHTGRTDFVGFLTLCTASRRPRPRSAGTTRRRCPMFTALPRQGQACKRRCLRKSHSACRRTQLPPFLSNL